MYQNLAVLAALLVLYASLAGALESKPINGPLLFLLAGLVTGPSGLGLLNLSLDRNDLRFLAELTLSIVLFNDAAKADLAQLRQSRSLPLRLLTLGLPLTLIAGWLAAWLSSWPEFCSSMHWSAARRYTRHRLENIPYYS